MKNTEIIQKLQEGSFIKVERVLIIKYRKVKGSKTRHSIDGKTITSSQFDKLYENGIISKLEENIDYRTYKLKQ